MYANCRSLYFYVNEGPFDNSCSFYLTGSYDQKIQGPENSYHVFERLVICCVYIDDADVKTPSKL